MTASTQRDLVFTNPNWSAFVLAVAALSERITELENRLEKRR